MSNFSKLPDALAEKLIEASGKIGSERALIALQGIVQHAKPLRVIDGTLRQETLDAVAKAVEVSGIETLIGAFVEKVEMRFPGTFQEDADDLNEGEYDAGTPTELTDAEDLEPVVSPRRRKKADG